MGKVIIIDEESDQALLAAMRASMGKPMVGDIVAASDGYNYEFVKATDKLVDDKHAIGIPCDLIVEGGVARVGVGLHRATIGEIMPGQFFWAQIKDISKA